MSFNVITPIDITDSILTESSIPEPDTGEAEWLIGTTYAIGDTVYLNHIMYESLISSNTGNSPDIEVQNDVDNPPTKWLEVGRTNKWNMFNLLRNNQSITTSPLIFELTPAARINSIGIFGLDAQTINIVAAVDGLEVYNYTEDLNTRNSFTYYDYCYEPFSNRPSMVVFDLPPITDLVIAITITSDTGTVKVGSVAIGNYTDIGKVLYGAESDVLNFSRIDRAFDGTALLKPRRSIPKINVNVVADKELTNKIRALRTNLNAVPAVWAGIDQTDDDYFEALLIIGIYKKFIIKLDHPTVTQTEIEIEEI